MRNYMIYFFVTAVIALLLLMIVFSSLYAGTTYQMAQSVLLLLPLGAFQLLVGVILSFRHKAYPKWVGTGLRYYWGISASYFLVLFALIEWLPNEHFAWSVWLLFVPWLVAIYQVVLVVKMARFRGRQLEKREFVQLYKH